MRELGASLAGVARFGDVYGLVGPLGAGKTELVRGFVAVLEAGAVVRSPSFPIVNRYPIPDGLVYHFDFYRINKAEELLEIGFAEYCVEANAICLIEWADMFIDDLPLHTKYIKITDRGDGCRLVDIPDDMFPA